MVEGGTEVGTFPRSKWSGRRTSYVGPNRGLLVPLGTTNRVDGGRQTGPQTTPSSSHPIKIFNYQQLEQP